MTTRKVEAASGRAVRDVVRRSRVVLVGSHSAKGHPFCTPLWFVRDPEAIYLTTGRHSWLGRNVTANPQVTLLFGGERGTGPRAQVRGTATVHDGMIPWRLGIGLILRYYVAPGAFRAEVSHLRQWRLRQRYYEQTPGQIGYVRVVPTSARLVADPST